MRRPLLLTLLLSTLLASALAATLLSRPAPAQAGWSWNGKVPCGLKMNFLLTTNRVNTITLVAPPQQAVVSQHSSDAAPVLGYYPPPVILALSDNTADLLGNLPEPRILPASADSGILNQSLYANAYFVYKIPFAPQAGVNHIHLEIYFQSSQLNPNAHLCDKKVDISFNN